MSEWAAARQPRFFQWPALTGADALRLMWSQKYRTFIEPGDVRLSKLWRVQLQSFSLQFQQRQTIRHFHLWSENQ